MEQFTKLEIVESNISNDLYDGVIKNILSWLFTSDDKNNSLKLNPDYKTILYNNNCCAISFVKQMKGWEEISDIDYFAAKLNRLSSERKTYIQYLENLDPNFYNVMSFYIKCPPTDLFYFAIIGKKIPQLSECINSQKESNQNISSLMTDVEKLTKSNEDIYKFINKSLMSTSDILSEKINTSGQDIFAKLKEVIEIKKTEQKKYSEQQDSLLEDRINAKFDSISEKINEYNDAAKEIQVNLTKNINSTCDEINSKTENFISAINDNFENVVNNIKNDYAKNNEQTQQLINDNLNNFSETLKNTHDSITDKMNKLEEYSSYRDSQYIKQFEDIKIYTETKYTEQKNEISVNFQNFTTQINKNLADFSENGNKSASLQNEKIDQFLSSLNNKTETFNNDLLNKINSNHEMIMEIINFMKNDFGNKFDELKTNYDKQLNNLNKSLDDIIDHIHPDGTDISRL